MINKKNEEKKMTFLFEQNEEPPLISFSCSFLAMLNSKLKRKKEKERKNSKNQVQRTSTRGSTCCSRSRSCCASCSWRRSCSISARSCSMRSRSFSRRERLMSSWARWETRGKRRCKEVRKVSKGEKKRECAALPSGGREIK